VSRENGYVLGLSLNYLYEQPKDFCNVGHENADVQTVTCQPGEIITGLKVCRGSNGGVKKVLVIKDTGAVETCGNTDTSYPAYDYNWNQFGKKMGYRVGNTKAISHRAFGFGMKTSNEHLSCTFFTPKTLPKWSKSFEKPWMAYEIADHLTYTIGGQSYQKHAWTGPYTKDASATQVHDPETYDGYFKQVHPFSDITAKCNPNHNNALWDIPQTTFNKCFLPEHAHVESLEVQVSASMGDYIACADLHMAKQQLVDVVTAGVQHVSNEPHLSFYHDFACNDVNGVATLVTTITPMGHSDAFDLAHKLRPLTESDICEASRGGGNPLFAMFCRNSFDRSVKVYMPNELVAAVADADGKFDPRVLATGQAFSL